MSSASRFAMWSVSIVSGALTRFRTAALNFMIWIRERSSGFGASSGSAIRQGLRIVVALYIRAAIEDLRIALRDLLMQRHELAIHVARGTPLQLQVMKSV